MCLNHDWKRITITIFNMLPVIFSAVKEIVKYIIDTYNKENLEEIKRLKEKTAYYERTMNNDNNVNAQ